MSFVHLHVHTDYSLLDGAASIKKLVSRAVEQKMPGLAITDHGNMFGALRFYKECRANNINPLVGSEFYVAKGSRKDRSESENAKKRFHLILLAKNETGYKNLVMLSSRSYTEGFYYKPRIDWELLENYHDGLICCSACFLGEVPQSILSGNIDEAEALAARYRDLFGKENYFLEVQDHGIDEEKRVTQALIPMSKRLGVGLVATNDIHYLDKEDAFSQDVLLCVGMNRKVTETNRMKFSGSGFYFRSEEEMASLFSEVPEAISNTALVNEMCNLTITLPGPLLPEYQIPSLYSKENDIEAEPEVEAVKKFIDAMSNEAICKPNPKKGKIPTEELAPEVRKTLDERFKMPITRYFVWNAFRGLEERYPVCTEKEKNRLVFELSTIILMDFVGYFLIVADFINWSKDHNIPVGPGRGSGAGSIVAYCMKITDIDPLHYDLLFERFLNPERISMPDFDVDICNEGRPKVIEYVTEKYGREQVGQIVTFGTLKAKQVIKDVARALDISIDESNRIAKLIPEDPKMTLAKAFDESPELKALENEPRYQQLFEVALKLENKNRHTSLHASGIVIGKTALTDYVPLFRDAKTGAVATQYTMDQIEDCGLVKMDFLGLKTLTLIKHTLEMMAKSNVVLKDSDIPIDDKETFSMLSEGKSSSVFQFESPGMQKWLKEAHPAKIEDLIALNALYRPGPMDNIPTYVACKMGIQEIQYPAQSLEKYLKETYGIIVYQEQVMQVAQELAGYSLGRADLLRRAMGKKKKEIIDAERKPFVEGSVANGYSKEKANEIYDILVPFSGYGFNKSHAAAYSVVAYRTAWLKCHYPAEFMAANLTNEINSPDKLTTYIGEARAMGLKLLPPNINYSEASFSVTDGQIVYGLIGIKGIGQAVVDSIVTERSKKGIYKSFIDFLERVGVKCINKKSVETLIKAGCFDSLGETRSGLILNYERAYNYVQKMIEAQAFGQTSLFGEETGTELPPFTFDKVDEMPRNKLLEIEKELLGFYFSGHPLDEYKKEYERCCDVDFAQINDYLQTQQHPERFRGKNYTLIGQLIEYRETYTKATQEKMALGKVDTYDGTIAIKIPPAVLKDNPNRFVLDTVLFLYGSVNAWQDKVSFYVHNLVQQSNLRQKVYRNVHIALKKVNSADELDDLRSTLFETDGSCSVIFHVNENGKDTMIKANSSIHCSTDYNFLDKIIEIPVVNKVWID